MHLFFLGAALGFGAAIPVGPINLEMTRLNLRFAPRFAIALGFGACTADVIYLLLIAIGALTLLQQAWAIKTVGFLGALVLTYFAINALKLKSTEPTSMVPPNKSVLKNYLQGILMTLTSPYTIIFWASVSSHIVISAKHKIEATTLAGLGVAFSSVVWIIFLNSLLHVTRHKLSDKAVYYINVTGGLILLGFACAGFYQALFA